MVAATRGGKEIILIKNMDLNHLTKDKFEYPKYHLPIPNDFTYKNCDNSYKFHTLNLLGILLLSVEIEIGFEYCNQNRKKMSSNIPLNSMKI